MNWIFNRNNGVRVSDKLKFQNGPVVIIENELISVTTLPAKGADIVSFYSKTNNCECLLTPLCDFTPVGQNPNVPDYISGTNNIWPEMFPTASSYGNYNGIAQPFHGEAHVLAWRHDIITDSPEEVKVRFSCQMQISPFKLERTVTIKTNDPNVYFDEKVTNISAMPMPLNWGHHPTFGSPFLSEHCKIYLPEGKLHDCTEADMKIDKPNSGKSVMGYLTDFKKGYYGLFNHEKNFGFGMSWDSEIFKTIWIWQALNSTSTAPWHNRAYTMALEPVMSFPQQADNPKDPALYVLQPNATLETSLKAFIFDDPKKLDNKF